MNTEVSELMGDDPTTYYHFDRSPVVQQTPYVRRGSLKPHEPEVSRRGPVQQRPPLQGRTNSAPVVERARQYSYSSALTPRHFPRADDDDEEEEDTDEDDEDDTRSQATSYKSGLSHWQEDEDVPPVPPKRFDSLAHLENQVTEINVAVIGAEGVGKTTFLQRALDLPSPPQAGSAEQKVASPFGHYLVRLLEIPIDNLNVDDDDDTICWPDTVGNKMLPKIDGALTLYDVKDKASLDQVPEVLTALSKASLPSILISCKCDVAPFERDLDPVAIEEKAKRTVRNLVTLQTSNTTSDNHKRGISMIIRAITARAGGELGARRRRAQSNAYRHVSPASPGSKGHVRATSEHSSVVTRQKFRQDATTVPQPEQLKSHELPATEEHMGRSFLIDTSGTESSGEGSELSVYEDATTGNTGPDAPELGATFDELVDKLLAQPLSKADGKFAAIFLALYRKFAAPSRLFEAIVERFSALDKLGGLDLTKTTAQLRYLNILDQWISNYPGDFAFAKTKRRMQTFIAKIGPVAILSAAANEMGSHLTAVHIDDDTYWAYSDEDREVLDVVMGHSALPPPPDMIDDLEMYLPDSLGGLTVTEDVGLAATLGLEIERPQSDNSTTSSQVMFNLTVAQREAARLDPSERIPLSKDHWRVLMDIPDDVVANELTRMDWLMFSSIRPRDLVRHVSFNSLEKNACKNLVNVDRMINHFNIIAAWVANFILLRERPRHRAMIMEKFMRVARKLRELNNYNSLGAIIAGIKSSSIHRLAATRDLLPPAVGKDWLKLEILMAPTRSHAAYRLAWENSSGERIPYIPLHRRDLVSAEEGNKTFIGEESQGRINWKKFEVMGEVIVSLQRAQGLPYRGLVNWRGGEQVKELVLDLQLVRDDEALYERSTHCEPPVGSTATTTTARFRDFFKR